MLSVYIDDSRDDTGKGQFVLAGWASTAKGWRGFDKNWTAALHKYPRMEILKTSEFLNLKGRYDPATTKWTEGKRDAKAHRLAKVIARHAIAGVAIAIDQEMFDRLGMGDGLGKKDSNPFLFCYPYLLRGMPDLATHLRKPGITVDMIYDEDRDGKGNKRAEELFAPEVQEAKRRWLNRIIPSTDEKNLQLQTADFLAWQMRQKAAGREFREDLFVHVFGITVMHYRLTEADLLRARRAILERRKKKPEEV